MTGYRHCRWDFFRVYSVEVMFWHWCLVRAPIAKPAVVGWCSPVSLILSEGALTILKWVVVSNLCPEGVSLILWLGWWASVEWVVITSKWIISKWVIIIVTISEFIIVPPPITSLSLCVLVILPVLVGLGCLEGLRGPL